jgi:hypothetical protein
MGQSLALKRTRSKSGTDHSCAVHIYIFVAGLSWYSLQPAAKQQRPLNCAFATLFVALP